MRYTVQYIPIHKIKSVVSHKPTQRSKELRKAAQDFMQLLVVRRSRKDRGFFVIGGNHHFEYFKRHTNRSMVPCLVDESKASSALSSLLYLLRKQKVVPNSWSIIRTFLKQEPRFRRLSRSQQLSVLRLGLQYKRTTLSSMKAKVDSFYK